MEQPGPERLRVNHTCHSIAVKRSERRVVDDHREVKETAKRLAGFSDFGKKTSDIVSRTSVALHDLNGNSSIAQTVHQLFGFRRSRTTPA